VKLLEKSTKPIIRRGCSMLMCALNQLNTEAQDTLENTYINEQDKEFVAACLVFSESSNRHLAKTILEAWRKRLNSSDGRKWLSVLKKLDLNTSYVQSAFCRFIETGSITEKVKCLQGLASMKVQLRAETCQLLCNQMVKSNSQTFRQFCALALVHCGDSDIVENRANELLQEENKSQSNIEGLLMLRVLGSVLPLSVTPDFLCALSSPFINVRMTALKVVEKCKVYDEEIIATLIFLLRSEIVLEMKLAVIHTLGKIGCVNPNVLTPSHLSDLHQELLYSSEDEVRKAAFSCLNRLNKHGYELTQHQIKIALDNKTDEGLKKKLKTLLRDIINGDK